MYLVCPVHCCKRSVCLFNRILQSEYDQLKQAQYEQQTKSPYDNVIDEIQRNGELSSESRDAEMIAEAKLLRQHKGRLEARMQILEDHNNQLDAQLRRLRQLLAEQVGMSGYEQVDMSVHEQVDMSAHEEGYMLVYSSNVIFRIFEYLLTSRRLFCIPLFSNFIECVLFCCLPARRWGDEDCYVP